MDRETNKWLIIIGIAVIITVLLLLALSGFDISGLEIRKEFKIN